MKLLSICLLAIFWTAQTSLRFSVQVITTGVCALISSSLKGLQYIIITTYHILSLEQLPLQLVTKILATNSHYTTYYKSAIIHNYESKQTKFHTNMQLLTNKSKSAPASDNDLNIDTFFSSTIMLEAGISAFGSQISDRFLARFGSLRRRNRHETTSTSSTSITLHYLLSNHNQIPIQSNT